MIPALQRIWKRKNIDEIVNSGLNEAIFISISVAEGERLPEGFEQRRSCSSEPHEACNLLIPTWSNILLPIFISFRNPKYNELTSQRNWKLNFKI